MRQCACSGQALPFSRSLNRPASRVAVTGGPSSVRGSTRSTSPLSSCRAPFLGVSPLSSPAGFERGPAQGRASRHVPRAQSGPDIPDRLAGAVPYLVPLFDSLKYGGPLQQGHCHSSHHAQWLQLPIEQSHHHRPSPESACTSRVFFCRVSRKCLLCPGSKVLYMGQTHEA